MKQMAIVTGDQVVDVVVSPGTSVQEVLQQLSLPGSYVLSEPDGRFLGGTQSLYDLPDGSKLFASPPVDVGCFYHGTQ